MGNSRICNRFAFRAPLPCNQVLWGPVRLPGESMNATMQMLFAALAFAMLLPGPGRAQTIAAGRAEHFIIIGVDGLSVDGVARNRSPRIHELMAQGAWTLRARGVMPTLSSPNWASMIMGAGPEQHG